jgi:hypothetical protein
LGVQEQDFEMFGGLFFLVLDPFTLEDRNFLIFNPFSMIFSVSDGGGGIQVWSPASLP